MATNQFGKTKNYECFLTRCFQHQHSVGQCHTRRVYFVNYGMIKFGKYFDLPEENFKVKNFDFAPAQASKYSGIPQY